MNFYCEPYEGEGSTMEPQHRTIFYIELLLFRQELEYQRDMA